MATVAPGSTSCARRMIASGESTGVSAGGGMSTFGERSGVGCDTRPTMGRTRSGKTMPKPVIEINKSTDSAQKPAAP